MGMEGGSRTDDDKKRDDIGESHPKVSIDTNALKLRLGLVGCSLERLGSGALLYFLNFFFGLPEKEIGADRRAQDSDDDCEVAGTEREIGNNKMIANRRPGCSYDHRHTDIGEERDRKPFEECNIARVAHEDLENAYDGGKSRHVQKGASSHEQLEGRRHSTQIRAEVDGVGHDK